MRRAASSKGVGGLILKIKRGESRPYRLLRHLARALLNPAPPRVPSVLRPLLRCAYESYYLVIAAVRWLVNFFLMNPLFQGRCASFGKGVVVDKLPFVSGHVEIHVGDHVHIGRVNPRISFNGSYTLGKAESDTDGAGTFPSDSYNVRPEYGRAGFDTRHRVQFSGSFAMRWGFRLSPMLIATSTRPFNITVGRDLNGDTLFTDRPAFATDLTRPSVRETAFGVFDLAPLPGQAIVPRDFGVGPALVSLNLRLAKTFKLGKEAKGKRDPVELTFTALSRNLLNHPNLALPVGNLSSPLFGESTALVAGGGGKSASGNRRIELQVRLAF